MTPGSIRSRLVTLIALVAVLAAGSVLAIQWRERAVGRELFDGTRTLNAHLDGHGDSLPPMASRCTNCHAGAQMIGGVIDETTLTRPVARRGGPPSRYDEAAFCKLLRTGIDPAWVLLPRAMPRYRLDNDECSSLWTYVSNR
jgi:hypothetical protein